MNKLNIKQKMLLAAGVFLSGSALAQESPAQAAMQSLTSEAAALTGDAWPIATAVVVGLIGIKLFKKFASRAS